MLVRWADMAVTAAAAPQPGARRTRRQPGRWRPVRPGGRLPALPARCAVAWAGRSRPGGRTCRRRPGFRERGWRAAVRPRARAGRLAIGLARRRAWPGLAGAGARAARP